MRLFILALKDETPQNPCQPTPCGPNSQCREVNAQAVCSCLPNYSGSPPGCRPECTVSSECPQSRACINQKCVDPCPGTCGLNSNCQVINHSPICTCTAGHTGDPFTRCFLIPPPALVTTIEPVRDPCVPSPCGPNSQCLNLGGSHSCSCLPNYVGSPPNCRPECTINSECSSNLACIREKCRDPCPGSCGAGARCGVINHTPICTCPEGYTGDPFTYCQPKPPTPPEPVETDPCNPSPCGPNAQCNDGICTCLAEYQGDPYRGCRPECVLNNDCPRHQACIRNKCGDPCPGTCGQNAECSIVNHIPVCTCISGYAGNAFVLCNRIPAPAITNPCNPSPCGPNSQCREVNGQAVCSCVLGYQGSPPACRPECVTSSECSLNQACVNQKCIDPCPGTCGISALCQVVNHNPICSCPAKYSGDPFVRCSPIPLEEPPQIDPCNPSPCGPNAQCREINNSPSCSCLSEFIGSPPNCRPECVSNSECASHLACINQKCKDPCPGICGQNAECRVVSHTPNCVCTSNYVGNPFIQCLPPPTPPVQELITPCSPSPCGANAQCREQNNAGSCTCLPDYIGNPYEGCRPECTLNSDCPSNKACIRNKCMDPCPGTCGQNAECQVINHLPSCTCISGYTGDPFRFCNVPAVEPVVTPPTPCTPSPCGPNSQCREVNAQAVCSCLPTYIGSPPGCRPECTVSSECPQNRACINQKCVDPCPGTCGLNANCQVINHSPICSCKEAYTGDPFSRCFPIPPPPPVLVPEPYRNPCMPSPCGPNSQCRDVGGSPSCSCLSNYVGSPPNCRPECTINPECSSNLACIREKCRDPCPGSCGAGAQCSVINHTPICTCPEGYTGDPFSYCQPKPPTQLILEADPCNPSPCGSNAACNDGICTCLPEYQGDPYRGCRPECVLNNDCPRDKACSRNKCVDPCPGTCGQNAECFVTNHIPICTCIEGYQGNAFVFCSKIPAPLITNPCNPSPCGPNSQCREINNQAVCSCVPGFIGSPPACRPECISSTECPLSQACVNQKCIDPCPGTCGIAALCQVVNHNPICSCPSRQTGDPFVRCLPIRDEPVVPINPCQPSPCGPNAQCKVVGDQPSCSCLAEFIGSPPNCRPECVSNSECANHLACTNQKCKDPCPGTCGENAECRVISHTPNCVCQQGYIGDPFSRCSIPPSPPPDIVTPCTPSPCGANAICREQNNAGSCTCLPEYIGNPYEGCRPECVLNSDCPSNKACVRNKCQDPCPGTCGQNAECQVVNHLALCTCITGYTGDPFAYCTPFVPPEIQPEPKPCQPSPCGPNSQCREVNEQAVCSCLPTYIGSPPACRPECVASSECSLNKACANQKCVDPCPGVCGLNTKCEVINHSPICSCLPRYSGDPFTRCYPIPPPEPEPVPQIIRDPCVPSPCGPNAQCRDIGGAPSCSCLADYFGNPPNCRPECTINSECSSNLACIRQKCIDPCPGSCGYEARCNVINHTPTCTCPEGYTGDPFTNCQIVPLKVEPLETDKCNPSPCGANTRCDDGICTCLPEYQGDPYRGCRPECILNNECPRDKACIQTKCKDPCPGTCGQNAECAVINHIPTCSCIQGYIGNAFVLCNPIPPEEPKNPCSPSPCGPNSQCREVNGQAVCSCVPSYIGTPPACRPECVSSAECLLNQACVNQRCVDPCPGTCGINALCQVVNHNPICSCQSRYTGDPFTRCIVIREEPPVPTNPCQPSPCGPNAQCKAVGDSPSCSCLSEFIGSPPNCRPECVSNSECANHLACINQKCKDPCPGTCGQNAECRVVSHTPNCVCLPGYIGDPFSFCNIQTQPVPLERPTPCLPSPCGSNAECKERNGAGACTCLPDYIGNPYEGCRPECVLNSDCQSNKACVRNKCVDPCPGTCGQNANCQVVNHLPSCTCVPGFTGDPFRFCYVEEEQKEVPPSNPCQPSPCGPNSQCREVNEQAVCSCLPNYVGSPPGCRPECVVSSECPQNRACVNQKCVDPCPGTCGLNANCQIINHSPICSCQSSYTGDPFTRCYPVPPPLPAPVYPPTNPCVPSPCGPNSQCRDIGGSPSCSCLSNYIGNPPNCRPECTINPECPSSLACIREKCGDPCPGSCGSGAQCNVINHTPICTCLEGYTGDPFTYCQPKPPVVEPVEQDLCNPSPCGPNAQCDNGICTCISEYQGDPYAGCRPECILNNDCSRDRACIRNKCVDPCPGTCGQNAECAVINHIPTCTCIQRFVGNAFVLCTPVQEEVPKNPCNPTPCGPNSQCREINEQAVCSCVPGFIGSPPACRPECVSSSECALSRACLNQKCIDPCPGTCGLNANCQVVNHNPICSCAPGQTGDPFTRCLPIREEPPVTPPNPCQPSPCGPNAQCRVVGEAPSCSCIAEFIGTPPNCRPECVSNSECASHLACINQKCKDPCPGICGQNAECRVVSHTPNCVCLAGFIGNPFIQCQQKVEENIVERPTPCVPSPCGANAECRERNGAGSCSCIPDYLGNPYDGCRPECTLNSDCPSNKACVRNKCVDPCPGTCGQNAECQVINHLPSCTCISGYTGDPFRYCNLPSPPPTPPEPLKPCQPSPCGPNSQCREVNEQAVCSCLPNYIGSPPGCRPECVVSSECDQNRACLNQKCVDPCPGTCGLNSECQVINHSPICSCKSTFTGDPFTRCYPVPAQPPPAVLLPEPCVPSPCGPNSQCRDVGGVPSCSCLLNYIGSPPNCRPECTINPECSSNLACIREKCIDPCPGSCGAAALCSVINHTPTCTCPEGYTGDPFSYCQPKPPEIEPIKTEPCNPSPCGPNAQCDDGICTCLPEYQGDPYRGCRPECVLNSDCSRDLACIRNKCKDPCPGTCGQNAQCAAINHIPTCTCLEGYQGNAFVLCTKIPVEIPKNPCSPSPCGPNSQCREINAQAVCSCVPGFIGSPPACRPECVTSTECSLNEACANQKCIDPCPGTCGLNARCQVVNHNPICSCPTKYSGDPFTRCLPIREEPAPLALPCQPSPCGPNAQCRDINGSPSCSCLPEFTGSPPNCRPECVSNSECANHLACINQKCKDPCPGICGSNAECRVVSHTPNCVCSQGYVGNPFTKCDLPEIPIPTEPVHPCFPSPCGANAVCREQNGAGSCSCIEDYLGNPYEGCRPECVLNSDCPSNRACVRTKCVDPCPGTCGQNAECQVINHLPSCTCIPGYTGDPFRYCDLKPSESPPEPTNPCQPNPCGPNSQCREVNTQAVCSCLPSYIGSPPGCRPECTVSSECSLNQACINQKCVDPCPGTCGLNARCEVINHSPICSCSQGHTGDPFTRCYPVPPPPPEPSPPVKRNPCVPSPCGPHSICQDINGAPSCSCIVNYLGSPPNCRPECTINPECPSNLVCSREKCRDPCPGSCGAGAQCSVINHTPICTCPEGYTGDPFSYCNPKPLLLPETKRDPCNPSPCGANTQCDNGICTCLSEYQGDPYRGCRPECVLNTDCPRDRACIRNKCADPCPGTCGQNAECAVINHIPTCSCLEGNIGNAFVLCSPIPARLPKNPCNPSPCGQNSQCREINEQAVCSCVPGYIGSPPTCRPECVTSTECSLDRACVNQKCIDPCPGTCGLSALCQIVNHNPICSCPPRYSGDPFFRCVPLREEPTPPEKPCQPSPCGPNAQCRDINGSPSCSCLPEFTGSPPNCRPECVSNTECSNHLACINQKCKDPCPGTCGLNAECRVVAHTPNCVCIAGYSGNPFQQCLVYEVPVPKPADQINPCFPSPCGANAICKERNNAGSCICLPEYIGNPYEGCRPECVLNSDCPSNKACISNRCSDPCPGTCGQNANCQVISHLPSCSCISGYTGDPFRFCNIIAHKDEPLPNAPCQPTPCGPNSQCREVNGQAVCSCLPNYIGSPPGCRPECTVSSECAQNRACTNQKCVDPCPGTCGLNAQCNVINHSPICSCSQGYIGDPFTRCYTAPPPPPEQKPYEKNPCVPSPCGSNSQCRDLGGNPSCSCLPNYIGSPPSCRPECTINSECSSNLACINEKCKDPCPGSCGIGAICEVRNHNPTCVCPPGYAGDAFIACAAKPSPPPPSVRNPCYPNPCGPNARCDNGTCTCYPEYLGDPYRECRPECVLNSDCSRDKACINQKCKDPCPGTCGQNAECNVFNHYPSCSCIQGFSGDPFIFCTKIETPPPKNPCNPSPCGPNSQCREVNEQAVCSCLQGFIGSPPACRPECVSNSECSLNRACVNQKCIDPCPGTCGLNALCQVVNHNPICTCPARYSGDPFIRCQVIIERPKQPVVVENPCVPSPCGPNAQCEPTPIGTAKCTCLAEYIGAPPNCRPECLTNNDCSKTLTCINHKCGDPCPGSCGLNARCFVVNHVANCICIDNYIGDPFTICTPKPQTPTPPPRKEPCFPSPCGPNAHCRAENDYAVCECLPEYHGNPYESCRPECLTSADCAMNTACIRNKCQDPCPGTCGIDALCSVTNHVPVCSCPDKYTGDAFRLCTLVIEEPPSDPCNPSPCGINTVCRQSNKNAICECLPGFFGTPSAGGCRPECTISADCARNRACVNTKCIDPCPGVCGFAAVCNVINHSPVCSCPAPLVGDPFTLCREQEEPKNPCNPSPCNLNGQCREVNGVATCIYPECIINQDCPRDKACYSQKCRDPCRDACGLNALCQVVNHKAVCSCPAGYIGSPEVQCRIQPEVPPKPKVECTQDAECTNDKACINTQCQNPCSATPGICGLNAQCHPQVHRAVCSCRDGFTGNAQQACLEIGCRSDSECPPTQACINRDCVDPCTFTSCGVNALCRADVNHKARCYCPDNFRGDPSIRCERPECTVDDECSYNLACRNERCEDPCNCGLGALCTVINHRAKCSCPPGYTGNPLTACNREHIVVQPECKMDADCASKLACFSGVCKNPCYETKPCGVNAECIVVDSLPLRTMSCMCLPGYVGDADTECRLAPQEPSGCKSNDECPSSDTCLNRQCVNPCAVGSPCALSAECTPTNHKAVCRCPAGLSGDPFIRCYEQPKRKPECSSESECSNDKSCINQRCQDPCALSNPCGSNAQCRTSYHRPTCICPDGWLGNPQVLCYKPECKSNDDCPYNRACINENCENPCTSLSCGRGAECQVLNHHAQCQCPAGTQGDPLLSCIIGVCQYNEDCADHEACDRLNRVCRPVCDEDTCAETASCIGQQHQPKCFCPVGTSGNPYVQCIGYTPSPGAEPECRSDSECTSQLACINQHCISPCASGNVCTPDQECRVLDTLPLRTVMCQCPPDTIGDAAGRCIAIKPKQPQCHVDPDCDEREKCIRGTCMDACRVDRCGVNALCNSFNHQAICTCAPGYVGNAHVECTSFPKIPGVVLPPECYNDNDCTYDKSCHNERCVNPCRVDKPCASSAFCSVNHHKAICKCPAGYEGNPQIECIAPLGPVVGCTSNSECPRSESCINHLCASPCNCGPYAECKVVNHYPTCYCQPGYSGNPQIGCIKLGCQADNECSSDTQCYNGQCLNPCILGDPCARNAKCYGSNHRAACKCPDGYEGNPFDRCERVECHTDTDCPNNKACLQQRCVDPCSSIANPPCAQNAICYAQNHAAGCICPPNLPEGSPLSYCSAPHRPVGKTECELDVDCPSKLACIRNQCVNPCVNISPCHPTAQCSVLDTVPVRTMICTCPEGWVPNENGECHAVVVPIPPGCTSDDDCSSNDACINRLCRSPCDCGTNADCHVQNHRAICSCSQGYEGNPNIACHAVGCRIDSECESGKACINGNCINPCLIKDPCGINAECYVYQNQAQCRCASGYRGDPFDRCIVVGCTSNSECPSDRQCINAQCINPCIYDNPCSSRAECRVQNHMSVCRCPPGLIGNPYVDCRPEPQPECREDPECPARLACLNNKCQDPCAVLEPCRKPSECQVVASIPLRTLICICPPGYISSGSGTCNPVRAVEKVACVSDSDCSADKACYNYICKNPCNCGPNAECRVKDHKPVCTCRQGFDGNPEIECNRVGCRSDDECSGQHSCINRQCVPVCAADGSSCGQKATCYGFNHRATCECPPGLMGNPKTSCILVGCRSDDDCPGSRACINNKCELPCETANPCDAPAECKAFNHVIECVCPPGTVSDGKMGCMKVEGKCRKDSECPSQYACIGGECVNPCKSTEPCGVNAECTVLDTEPVRTMICQCLPGYQGNAAVQCDRMAICSTEKGLIRTADGKCVCPPNTALNENDECIPCPIEKGLKIDERGRCICDLEKGLIIDERGNCVCPIEFGYHLDFRGNCIPKTPPKCEEDYQCLDYKYCNLDTKTCDDPCKIKHCAVNALCTATNHRAVCQCGKGYVGDGEIYCNETSKYKTDFPRPDLTVSCLSDGVQVEITLGEIGFNGILYVKGHSKDEKCRRVVSIDSGERLEFFKVQFGNCGLIHVNGEASFVLVIQKHPKLVTYKAQAYHIKCVYQTGEQNVTLGFNVSMLTTAGTIANTGPPPTCLMKIVTPTGQEINSAEIGDNLMLQVDVQPGSIYGGFARSCVAKTMEDSVENEYLVTDENGCATDATIFGEWDYNPDTQSLLASFNAFKFPSSDNIRFQCNIRVCFGKCQPVNCRGYNAFGRRKRAIESDSENSTDVALGGDLLSGQLREEITIQSNAILTLERREERGSNPHTAPNAQRVEDICVSMIGFIIALIITALLSLVAVAVAVSCWLMAYRRRPKATGPLPHPPEFPNPLFTTPEPMAEPSPDYLT